MGGLNSGPHRSSRLHENAVHRFDVLELQDQAKAENWPDGTRRTLSFPAPHTGTIISARIRLTFIAEPFGGRRIWFSCPECPRRVRFLFGGRSHLNKAQRIACRRCMRLRYASECEGPERRWRRQMAKLEQRLGGDPRKLTPPQGLARR